MHSLIYHTGQVKRSRNDSEQESSGSVRGKLALEGDLVA